MIELSATQLKLLRKLGAEAGKYLKAQIEKDKANRYSLKKDWVLPRVPFAIGDFENEAFAIVSDYETNESLILVKAFASTKENNLCDGATNAPDNFFGVNFVPSAVFHDRWYATLAQIAKETGSTDDILRKYGDQIFCMIAYAENGHSIFTRFVVSSYYYGIRLFGSGHVKQFIKRATLVFAVTVCVGSGGCANYFFPDEGEYETPEVEQVADATETDVYEC